MIYKCILFLVAALALANCCAFGNGCVPVSGTPVAWDGLGAAPSEETEPLELRPKQPARKKREAPIEAAAAAPTGKFQAKDSWGQQQIADQADEARLKRKLMICRSCLPGETVHEDTAGTATR